MLNRKIAMQSGSGEGSAPPWVAHLLHLGADVNEPPTASEVWSGLGAQVASGSGSAFSWISLQGEGCRLRLHLGLGLGL